MLPTVFFRGIITATYPIFKLPSDDIQYEDGLILYHDKIIDDKNMPGKSLGLRRLQTSHSLFPLRQSYSDIVAVLKSNNLNFIDSSGRPFRYKKSFFTYIRYKKIDKVERRDTMSIVSVKGIPYSFTALRPPPEDYWAGILYYRGHPWKLYEFTPEQKPTSRKKL